MLTHELLREALEAAAKATEEWPEDAVCADTYRTMHKGKTFF